MRTNGPWNWRLTVPKATKVTLVRPLMTNVKMTVRADCAVSFIYKSSCPTASGGQGEVAQWIGLWTDICPLPACFISNKQTFLSSNLACLLAFERRVARPHTPFCDKRLLHFESFQARDSSIFCKWLTNRRTSLNCHSLTVNSFTSLY